MYLGRADPLRPATDLGFSCHARTYAAQQSPARYLATLGGTVMRRIGSPSNGRQGVLGCPMPAPGGKHTDRIGSRSSGHLLDMKPTYATGRPRPSERSP